MAMAQEAQPFSIHTNRLLETLDFLGTPLMEEDKQSIQALLPDIENEAVTEKTQVILDKYCLFNISINPESRVKANQGQAQPILWEGGWRTFLIKVENQAGITAKLTVTSPQAARVYDGGEKLYGMGSSGRGQQVTKKDIADRWLDMDVYTKEPMRPTLTGMATEYFIVQLYSRDKGKRAAKFVFDVGQATQDIGFRSETDVYFQCLPAVPVTLNISDETGEPCIASLVIQDKQGHIYPSQAKRSAPDFFFQSQIYRASGEQINLPQGEYLIKYGRGPEYLTKTVAVNIGKEKSRVLDIKLERWINPNQYGWYSGDHHIHAAGCSHYESPTQGVNPADMMRHIMGEGVNVGSVLTWGPGYDHQKQFFEGKDNALSTAENLMRYDLEISGFPSSHAGHLVLLGLKDQYYPNTVTIEDWPTWTIPILTWAKAQGAITGYAHSGLGLEVKNDKLPNYEMPRFDGIGANEYIVAVTQHLVDFISTMDTPPTWELNIWYHTLNCGYRTRISGETDFPCMSDDKVAHGRSYVKLDNKLNFEDWVQGLKKGRTYVSEGKSHLMGFTINGMEVGTNESEIKLDQPATVHISADVAALLDTKRDSTITPLNLYQNVWTQKPFWNLERARIGDTNMVPVELIVNGEVVAVKNITADGNIHNLTFDIPVSKSSWVAIRLLPSSHTNPIFILINDQPIRASRQSAEWCLKAVEQCWQQKSIGFSETEKAEAGIIYEMAKSAYKKIINESENK